MPCTEFEELLTDYETLGAVERARVDAHLTHCEACRGWREAFAEACSGVARSLCPAANPASSR